MNDEAYSRRPCVVLSGVSKETMNFEDIKEILDIPKKELEDNIDKFHSINIIGKDSKRINATIVKFKSHAYKEKIYKKRKDIKSKHKVLAQPSLTKRRSKLLSITNQYIKTNKGCGAQFTLPDVHGNLLVFMPDQRKKFRAFNSMEDFLNILNHPNNKNHQLDETVLNEYQD